MDPRWWSMRPAQNLKPATYTCPFCGKRLAALSEHVLIAPEDDRRRRRHAHMECVRKARAAGKVPGGGGEAADAGGVAGGGARPAREPRRALAGAVLG